MTTSKPLSKYTITIVTTLLLSLGAINSFAQGSPETIITAVDPATGKVVEAPKLFSEMSEEEKAAYSEEDLKILEAHEAELKRVKDTLNY